MDLIKNRAVVINACVGEGWYPKGSERLKNSLVHHGWAGDVLQWINEWPNDNYDKSCPYNVKAAAFEEAINQGYTHILWLDSSVWAIKQIMPIFDIINEDGYYFWKSGYNCAQVCSDKCLEYFKTDRNKAEKYKDSSTSMMGVNMANPQGNEFITRWIQSAKDGVFSGSRFHDGQSQDTRFLFHRQDQSAASMIIGDMNLKMHNPNRYSAYYETHMNDSVILCMQGI